MCLALLPISAFSQTSAALFMLVGGRLLKLSDTHPYAVESLNNLIDLYETWNKPEKAKEWRAKLPQTEAVGE